MMNCDKALSLLSDYIEGTLEPQLKQELEDHLESDPECKKVFEDAQKIHYKLHSLAPVECSEEFETHLRNRIIAYNDGAEKSILQNKKGLSLVFSATGLVVVFMVMMFSDIGNDISPQEEFNSSSTIEMKSPPEEDKLAEQESAKDSLKKPDDINTDNITTANEKR